MNSKAKLFLSQIVAFCLAVAGTAAVSVGTAQAAADYGSPSISYSGVANAPTSGKPQSKLWWNDGSWWADMWTTGSGWSIYRLDRSSKTWVDTGVRNDTRSTTLADTLWDGSHLYIASHVVTVTGDGAPNPSVSGQPARLYRYSYSGGQYTLDAGFPTIITNNSSESLTIAKDTTGAIWATWTQVAGNSSSGYTNTVYMNASAPGGTSWSTPFVLPVTNPRPAPDDISAVVSYGANKIGVMWSDHLKGAVWWATRTDGTSPTATSSWKVQPAVQGSGQSDDHLNLKSLVADTSGRVFAAMKTSLNDTSSNPNLPLLQLLVFRPGTGAFTKSTIATTRDCVSRPQIILDTQNNQVHAFHTAPSTSVSGCSFSGVPGSIYEKTASMDNPVFGSGRGTPVIQDGASANVNDVTTTKQSVNSSTGIVALATNNATRRYWYSDRPLGAVPPPTAPVASFTASPTSGPAPLPVSFTDTSTGSPTSWSWTFGDGGTSTSRSPSHTYSTAGTYTVRLTAANSAGSTSSSATITVAVPAPGAPVASFTASPTSGPAPLPVSFTDTSTGSPTSWSWTFGDGGTSTSRNPSHTYSTAGTYTVRLTAANSAGSTSSSATITVTTGGGTGSVTAVGTSTTYSATAVGSVSLTKPAGTAAGDVLIASITTDLSPSMSAVPAGWTAIVNGLSINSSSSSGARVFVYYHVVGSADPASYTWNLGTAVKWGGGITAYRGVNQSTPLDSTVVTAVDTSYTATGITLPSITTASNGALLIGGVGFDSSSPAATPPSGWTERWEAAGGQVAEEADKLQPTAGASGTAVWTFAAVKAAGAWRTALKPAG